MSFICYLECSLVTNARWSSFCHFNLINVFNLPVTVSKVANIRLHHESKHASFSEKEEKEIPTLKSSYK